MNYLINVSTQTENKSMSDSINLESPNNSLSLTIHEYTQWAYVLVREFIEYYIPLSNNNDIHEIYPNLFIGNMSTSFNKDLLKQKGITHIVSAIGGFKPPYPKDFKYHVVNALDTSGFNIKPYLNDACFFIEYALKNFRKVYVHCMCGVSRSSTIIVAYLLDKMRDKTPEEIIEYLQTIRPVINPNSGFRKQLNEYANE